MTHSVYEVIKNFKSAFRKKQLLNLVESHTQYVCIGGYNISTCFSVWHMNLKCFGERYIFVTHTSNFTFFSLWILTVTDFFFAFEFNVDFGMFSSYDQENRIVNEKMAHLFTVKNDHFLWHTGGSKIREFACHVTTSISWCLTWNLTWMMNSFYTSIHIRILPYFLPDRHVLTVGTTRVQNRETCASQKLTFATQNHG